MYDLKVSEEGLYEGKYAATNEWEYFAETTEAFFSKEAWSNGREIELKNDFFPFFRQELSLYDRDMYKFWFYSLQRTNRPIVSYFLFQLET